MNVWEVNDKTDNFLVTHILCPGEKRSTHARVELATASAFMLYMLYESYRALLRGFKPVEKV